MIYNKDRILFEENPPVLERIYQNYIFTAVKIYIVASRVMTLCSLVYSSEEHTASSAG